MAYQEARYYKAALTCARRMQELAQTDGELLEAYSSQGLLHFLRRELDSALRCLEQALAFAQKLQVKSEQIGILNNIGTVYKTKVGFEKALTYYDMALSLKPDPISRAGILQNIGSVYAGINQYEQALEWYNRALKLYKQVGYRYGIATVLINLGLVHTSTGQISLAEDLFNRSLKRTKQIKDPYLQLKALKNQRK